MIQDAENDDSLAVLLPVENHFGGKDLQASRGLRLGRERENGDQYQAPDSSVHISTLIKVHRFELTSARLRQNVCPHGSSSTRRRGPYAPATGLGLNLTERFSSPSNEFMRSHEENARK